MLRTALISLALVLSIAAQAQEWVDAAMSLEGITSAEEADLSTLDHYEFLHLHRVRINGGRLEELLTPYQIATVKDYRHRCGDILSPAELALVDGFSPEKVRALEPFLSFESSRLPGEALKDTLQLHVKALLRADYKSIAGKLYADAGDAFQAGYARRFYYDGRSGGSFFASCAFPGGRFLAGNFNLRYGECLLFWSGMQMNTLTGVSGFSRRGGGLSPSWSLSGDGTFRGFAAEYSPGLWNCLAFVSESGSGGRISALSRSGSYGLNVLWNGRISASADIKQRLRGADIFGEAAYSPGRWAAVGGMRIPLSEGLSSAFRLQALPTTWTGRKYGEYTAAAGLEYHGGEYVKIAGKSGFGSTELKHGVDAVASLRLLPIPLEDPGRKEFKTVVSWGFRQDSLIRADTRFILRLRSYEAVRAELRTDLLLSNGIVSARLRMHGVWCDGPGFLTYTEYGYDGGELQVCLRGTLYGTRSWASRVYVYERDVPGGFSVPACYGEGASLSMLVSHTYKGRRIRVKSGLRAWISTKKPGTTAGLRFQVTLDHQY